MSCHSAVAMDCYTYGNRVKLPGKTSTSPTERNISTYEDPYPVQNTSLNSESTEVDQVKFKVVMIEDNSSEGCYGCKKKWRPPGCRTGNVPPIPDNMVLTRKERRCWRKDGILRVDRVPTNVYYHAREVCLKKKKASGINNITVHPDIQLRLDEKHLAVLKREFGLNIHLLS